MPSWSEPTATRSPMASDAISRSMTTFKNSLRQEDGPLRAIGFCGARLVFELGRHVSPYHHTPPAVVGLTQVRREHIATPVPSTDVVIDRDPHGAWTLSRRLTWASV